MNHQELILHLYAPFLQISLGNLPKTTDVNMVPYNSGCLLRDANLLTWLSIMS